MIGERGWKGVGPSGVGSRPKACGEPVKTAGRGDGIGRGPILCNTAVTATLKMDDI